MIARTTMIAALLATVALAGCTDNGTESAVICTNLGPITVDVYTGKTPVTANNFLDLAQQGAYDGVPFHRIISGFMMQGGDVTNGDGSGGRTADGQRLPDETRNDLPHDTPGLLSMANRGSDPTTGSSQFFITFVPTPHLDGKHVVFGEVTDGMDIVREVDATASSRSGTPQYDVYIQTVIVDGSDSDCPGADGVPEPVPAFACPTQERTETSGAVYADAITPGVLCITKTTDQTLVWARTSTSGEKTVEWSITGTGGSDLPDGWSVDFEDATGTIAGTDTAARTLASITVPEGTNGTFDLELHTGSSVTDLAAHVDLVHDELSARGSNVALSYAGSCTRDGTAFDSGDFSTTLGSGRTVAGFDLGLIGLGESETTTIVIPAPLGYGNNGPVCSGDDADLTFEVTINKL